MMMYRDGKVYQDVKVQVQNSSGEMIKEYSLAEMSCPKCTEEHGIRLTVRGVAFEQDSYCAKHVNAIERLTDE